MTCEWSFPTVLVARPQLDALLTANALGRSELADRLGIRPSGFAPSYPQGSPAPSGGTPTISAPSPSSSGCPTFPLLQLTRPTALRISRFCRRPDPNSSAENAYVGHTTARSKQGTG